MTAEDNPKLGLRRIISRGRSGTGPQSHQRGGGPEGEEALAAVRPDLFVTDTAPKLATAIVAAVCCGFGLLAFSGIAETSGFTDSVLSIVYTVIMLGLQLGYFSRPSVQLTPRKAYAALFIQACLVYLPILQFGTLWLGFPGFLAGSVLIALPARRAIPLFALIVASMAILELTVGAKLVSDVYAVTYTVVSTVITGLIVYGLTRLARLVGDLYGARDELRRMAIAEERLRFARDAHDLLGMNLSAITLKAELTNRLIVVNPERARAELADMLVMSRKAMSDVRMVVSGRRELSLDEELRSAHSVLSAADVDLRVEISAQPWPEPICA
ncbi:MAG: sensor histidine kinase, partial [Pseudonocardiaceae bacterium]